MFEGRLAREIRAEGELHAARARKLAAVFCVDETCLECGEPLNGGTCEACELLSALRVSLHEAMRVTAPLRRADGTYCGACDGEGFVLEFGAVGGCVECAACGTTGLHAFGAPRDTQPMSAVRMVEP
jgi:hypothetical protein